MSYHGVDRNFNVTALAKLTMYYPLPVLKQVLNSLMSPRRIIQLYHKPLTPQEVYEVCTDTSEICLNFTSSNAFLN